MKTYSLIPKLAFLLILITGFTNQQSVSQVVEEEEEKENPPIYHYACASYEENGKKVFYICNLATVLFYSDYDYTLHMDVINSEMERQFLEYLNQLDKYAGKKYKFVGYNMSANEQLIKDEIAAQIKKYQEQKYTIKKVKGFQYD